MSYDNGYEPEGQLQFVSDAVLAFAYALRDMHSDLCPAGHRGVCPQMRTSDGSALLGYLREVQFRGNKKFYYQKDIKIFVFNYFSHQKQNNCFILFFSKIV